MSNHTPIRCFEGNAQPHQPFWRFVNASESESGQPEMELYGPISEYSWFDDEVTPKMFKDDLYEFGQGGPIVVRINSPGGDIIAASVMRAIMTDYPGEITVRVDGLAASAAVAVAMAGKTIQMQDTAYMMIHDPAVVVLMAWLDIDTLKDLAVKLESLKGGLLDVYEARTGLGRTKLGNMMAEETWMSASEAVALGFADQVIQGGQNQAVAYVNALRHYRNVPPALLNLTSEEKQPDEADVDLEQVLRLRERVQKYLK